MVEVGRKVCPTQSSHITTASRRAWKWYRSRCCLAEGAEHPYFGMRQENDKSLALTLSKRLRIKFWSWRLHVSSQRKVHVELHWAIQNPRMKGRSSLSVGITAANLSGAWRVSRVPIEEVLTCTRGTSPLRGFSHGGGPHVSRVSDKGLGGVRTSHEEQDRQNVQGSMEPPHRWRSYLGIRGGPKDRVSRFLHRLVRISETRFLLRGVGL
jgi:hypothetical protein